MAKEEKELIERMGEEWGIFWISQGLEVYHRSDVSSDLQLKENATLIMVDRILKKQLKSDDRSNPRPFFIKGIACHWYKDGVYNTGTFHTKELLPASVVRKGPETLADWLDRKKT